MITKKNLIRWYRSPVTLLVGIGIGLTIGFIFKEYASLFKAIGDIFLNLLCTMIVPLVFFSISSHIASHQRTASLKKIMLIMLGCFTITGLIASLLMLVGLFIFPIQSPPLLTMAPVLGSTPDNMVTHFMGIFTVPTCGDLLHPKNMVALMIIALLFGFATADSSEDTIFVLWLKSAYNVCMRALSYIMLLSPVGIAAYCAYNASTFGYELLTAYRMVILVYYGVGLVYYILFYSGYVYITGGVERIKDFWFAIVPSATTSLATGSSFAAIPANIKAADQLKIPTEISSLVIPLGATVHLDGSCMAAMIKIAVLCSFFNIDIFSWSMMGMTIILSLLCGLVVSGIPAGGIFGEMLIISFFGLPLHALPLITTVGILVDPLATMINATGDVVVCLLVDRFAADNFSISKLFKQCKQQ